MCYGAGIVTAVLCKLVFSSDFVLMQMYSELLSLRHLLPQLSVISHAFHSFIPLSGATTDQASHEPTAPHLLKKMFFMKRLRSGVPLPKGTVIFLHGCATLCPGGTQVKGLESVTLTASQQGNVPFPPVSASMSRSRDPV